MVRVKSGTDWLPHCSVGSTLRTGIVKQCLSEKQIHSMLKNVKWHHQETVKCILCQFPIDVIKKVTRHEGMTKQPQSVIPLHQYLFGGFVHEKQLNIL